MAKRILQRILWLGRGTATMMGLALIFAVVLGVATTALAGTGVGAAFNLGKLNSVNAMSQLVGSSNTPMLKVDNNGTGPALRLETGTGKPPMTVNSKTKVANLNSDRLDGKDFSSAFNATEVFDNSTSGPLPVSNTFTSHGGTLLITASGSGYRSSQVEGNIGMWIEVLDSKGFGSGHRVGVYANERNSHKAFVTYQWVLKDEPADTYTLRLREANDDFYCNTAFEHKTDYCTSTDSNDKFYVTVLEIPD